MKWLFYLCTHTQITPCYKLVYISFPSVPKNYFFKLQKFPANCLPDPTLQSDSLVQLQIVTVVPCLYYRVDLQFQTTPILYQGNEQQIIKQYFYISQWIATDLARHLKRRMACAIFLEQDGLLMSPKPHMSDQNQVMLPYQTARCSTPSQQQVASPITLWHSTQYTPQTSSPPDYSILHNQPHAETTFTNPPPHTRVETAVEALNFQIRTQPHHQPKPITTPIEKVVYNNPSFNYTP